MANKILEDISKWTLEKRTERLAQIYEEKMGRPLHLDNPRYFTEAIQWIKLFCNNPLISKCVDKRLFKEYYAENWSGIKDLNIAKVIRTFMSPEEVDLSDLPDKFVIKSNCMGDGANIIPVADKSKFNLAEIEKEIRETWFNRLLLHTNSFASFYYPVQPCVLIEEYLDSEYESPLEFKFFCFHGKPLYIYKATNHFRNGQNNLYTVSFYDTNWNYLPIHYGRHESIDNEPRPMMLDRMLEIAECISKGFPFVRVDFFLIYNKIYIAELTFAPGAGLTRYNPDEFDLTMGDLLNINKYKKFYYI